MANRGTPNCPDEPIPSKLRNSGPNPYSMLIIEVPHYPAVRMHYRLHRRRTGDSVARYHRFQLPYGVARSGRVAEGRLHGCGVRGVSPEIEKTGAPARLAPDFAPGAHQVRKAALRGRFHGQQPGDHALPLGGGRGTNGAAVAGGGGHAAELQVQVQGDGPTGWPAGPRVPGVAETEAAGPVHG